MPHPRGHHVRSLDLVDTFVMVDWSAASTPGRPGGQRDGLWAAVAEPGHAPTVTAFRTRLEVRDHLRTTLTSLLLQGRRVLCGVDVAFGYPAGTARALGMADDEPPWRWTWSLLHRLVRDGPDGRNNRFAVADELNRRVPDGPGPFWGRPAGQSATALATTKGSYPLAGLAEFRATERHLRRQGHHPKSVWQLLGAGAVGGQSLTAIPVLAALRHHRDLRDVCRVWPFEPIDDARLVLAEVYPSLLAVDTALHPVRDAAQVLALARRYRGLAAGGELPGILALPTLDEAVTAQVRVEEGWVLPVSTP
jgi:hypothetical protein